MHDLSLTDRTLAALSTADLAVQEVDLPLRARRREGAMRLALVGADVLAVMFSLTIVSLVSAAPCTADEIKDALRARHAGLSHVTIEVAVCEECAP